MRVRCEKKKERKEGKGKLRCTGVISDVLKMHRRVKRIGTALSSIKLSLNLYSFHRGAIPRSPAYDVINARVVTIGPSPRRPYNVISVKVVITVFRPASFFRTSSLAKKRTKAFVSLNRKRGHGSRIKCREIRYVIGLDLPITQLYHYYRVYCKLLASATL